MRALWCAVVLLIAAVPVMGNPILEDVVQLELDDGTNCVWTPFQAFTIYVSLTHPVEAAEGITEFAFRLDIDAPIGYLMDERSLLTDPGQAIGSVTGDGLVCVVPEGCVGPDGQGRILVAAVEYFFTGEPGLITLDEHATEDFGFRTCSGESRWWNYEYWPEPPSIGVFMEPPEGCHGASPVRDMSWGSIKSLYR
jgi:hypothetical protein